MSSYQYGRGGRGHGDRLPRGGGQYDYQGHGSGMNPNWRGPPPQHSVADYAGAHGDYDNQSRGSGVNPNWRGPHPQHHVPGYDHAGIGHYSNPNPRSHYPQQKGTHDSHMGLTPRGPIPQQMHALQGGGVQNHYQGLNQRTPQQPRWIERGSQQTIRKLPAQYSSSTQLDQACGPNIDKLHHMHEETHLMQTIPQATKMATGGVVAHEKGEGGLEEQMSVLTIQPTTPAPSGSNKMMKFPHRPGKGTRGQRVIVRTNHFLVELSDKELHHYDVSITPSITSRNTNRVVMQKLVKAYQQSHLAGRLPVYDGRTNLYTAGSLPFEFQKFEVILSDEDGLQRERVFRVDIKHVGVADVRNLQKFLMGGQHDAPQDAIQALDIVLRERPSNSNNIIPVGRSFFSDSFGSHKLGEGLEGWQGFYKSLRVTQMGLSLNLDISATAFIESTLVSEFVAKLIGKDLNNAILTNADIVKIKRNLKGVKVEVTHRGNMRRKYRISGLTSLATRDLTFSCDQLGIKKTVVDYFRDLYGHNIRYINIPCLDVGNNPKRPNYLPMEVCKIVKGQKCRRKLNENQITNLLKVTCQKPVERENMILNTIRDNKYNEDMFTNEFGLTVSKQSTIVEARVLPPPLLKYHHTGAEKECMPRFGAWNLRDKKMVNGGKVNFWFCISFSPTVGANDAGWFCKKLGDMCLVSGMDFAPNPILPPIAARGDRLEAVLKSRYEEAATALSRQDKQPDLLIVILPNSNGSLYSNLKRICETDIGLVTQCCLSRNVAKASPQYLANLSLKINVKVGGRNTVLADAITRQISVVSRLPTIIFGADVSHPPPGEDTNPSIAAVVASQDWPEIATYAGTFRAQAHRQEIILHLGEMVKEHLISFRRNNNLEPKQIVFYRDGVSEGQFQKVLQYEIDAIRNACKQLHPDYKPTITFIVVQKRHHTRFFPADNRSMDRSGNVLPGTVVDAKICHPTEFDFYLCSHAGIQGTSRPAHYHVLWDDNRFSVDELQMLTYNLCYTYARCTRSVSIAPPAYYAHQIAYRARSYLDSGVSDLGSFASGSSASHGETSLATVMQLLPLKEVVKKVMFYC